MYRKKILFGIILFFCLKMYNQTKPEIGLKIGLNYAKLSPDYQFENFGSEKFKREIGYYFGGYINFRISERIKFQPEIIFSNQKTNIKLIASSQFSGMFENNVYFESQITESIISIPLIFQYEIGQKLVIEGGTQIGLIINQKEEYDELKYADFGNQQQESQLISNNNIDLGLVFGISYKISKKMKVNSRYFFGLIKRDSNIESNVNVWNLGVEYKI